MFNSIRWRLTLLMIVLAVLPLLAVGGVLIARGFNADQQHAEELQGETALRLANEMKVFFEDRPRELRLIAEVRGLLDMDPIEQENTLSEMLVFDSNFDNLWLVDERGDTLVSVSRRTLTVPGTEQDFSGELAFQTPLVTGRDYYSPVSFDRETGEPLMTIAVPLTDPRTGRVNSVLIGNFRIRSLSDLLVAQDFDPGQDVYLVAAGETHRAFAERVVAHRNASVVLGDRTFETHDLDAVTTGLEGDEVVAALQVFEVGNQEFTIVAELTTDEAFRDAFESLYTTLAGLAAVVLFTGVVGFVVLRRAMKPMGLLTSAAERLGAGDLSVQVDVRSRTEFGTLAQTFNTMAAQLRDVFGTLEARVQARTRDLQLAAQVSEQAAAILDLDQLLPQVVELVKDNFDLYHAHIYLLDDEKQNLILTAGAGEPGRIMKQRGHYIGINARGLVARAARESEPIIVADVSQDANFLPNPVLPDTRSEAAFPLAVHDRVLGVLDVQSERVGRFDQDILAVLSTLAGQIAVSLDNARLFSEVARASRHEHALTAITQEIQRATNIEEVMQAAARELGKALRVPRTAIQLQLPQGADETEPQPDLHS